VDPHTIDPFFEPLGTPARLIATASLARSLSAWTDGTPTIRIVPDTPSGAEVQRTRHGLHDALVRAGCWSIPGGELVPSTMSRPSCPADVADDHGSHAHVPEPYEDDAEITTDELARFIVELTDARGLTQRQQDRIEELTCSGTAAPTISLPNSLPRRLTTPTFQLVAARRAVAAHPDPELVGKGGSPLGNWPKFSKVSSTRRPERPSPEGGPCATLAQPHCTTWYHPDFSHWHTTSGTIQKHVRGQLSIPFK
jgi:hypothetical protein